MSYKFGLILSLTFLMAVLFLGGDLMNVATIKSSLDSLGTVVSYRIASEGTVSSSTKQLIASYHASFRLEEGEREGYRMGDTVTYYLTKEYEPFVLRKQAMEIYVRRSAVIGYYKN